MEETSHEVLTNRIRVVEVEPAGLVLEQVIRLGNADKKTLGFMPDGGFVDRAAKGHLLAATERETVHGYVLFDVKRDQVQLRHLCVAQSHRGHGIAAALVRGLRDRHRDRRGIYLECRTDYGLNKLWRALGFTPISERPGRGIAGKPLTLWSSEHGHADLLTALVDADARELAAVDHNILVDLTTDRARGSESRLLLEEWIADLVELCATDEVYHEVAGSNDAKQRKQMRTRLMYFRRLSPPDAEWQPLTATIAPLVPQAGEADICHLARSQAAGASYFVTRDRDILRGSRRLQEALGIEVLRPEELISRLDRLRAQERYEPAALQGTAIREIAAADATQEEVARAFLNYGMSETRARFLQIYRRALALPDEFTSRAFHDSNRRLLGMFVRHNAGEELVIDLLRAATGYAISAVVSRQLAYLQRKAAADGGLSRVVLRDAKASAPIIRALPEEGYFRDGEWWVAEVKPGMLPWEEVTAWISSRARPPDAAAAYEHRWWPLKVMGAGVPAFMVPIRPRWAEELFDTGLAERTLWGRTTSLGLQREHVYYRRPRNDRGIVAPARILWYVSAERHVHPEAHIRAVSRLEEVVVGEWAPLFNRFSHLGAYSSEQVRHAADDAGKVMALRFVDTEVLGHPVSLSDLRAAWRDAGLEFVPPISPQPVREDLFGEIYARGSAYARSRPGGGGQPGRRS
jgi:GNAT superfamily N-acetyltransferase